MSELSIRGLNAGYGAVGVLKDVSFTVPSGTLVAVVGSNGAGKSTLLRALTGLCDVTSGELRIDDDDLTQLPSRKLIRRGVAHVPENRRLFANQSVETNLRLASYPVRTQRQFVADRIADAYARFPILGERSQQQAGALSGGEQQMLALAMGTLCKPSVLLLDEPSLGLAPVLIEQIFSEITRLRDEGVTIVLVEQRASAAMQIADQVVVLSRGRAVAQGSPREIVASDAVRRAFLGEDVPEARSAG